MGKLTRCPICKSAVDKVFRGSDYFCAHCKTAICVDEKVTFIHRLGSDETLTVPTPTVLEHQA